MFTYQVQTDHLVDIWTPRPAQLKMALTVNNRAVRSLVAQDKLAIHIGPVGRNRLGNCTVEFPGVLTEERLGYLRLIFTDQNVLAALQVSQSIGFVEADKKASRRARSIYVMKGPGIFVQLASGYPIDNLPYGVQGTRVNGLVYSWSRSSAAGYNLVTLITSLENPSLRDHLVPTFLNVAARYL